MQESKQEVLFIQTSVTMRRILSKQSTHFSHNLHVQGKRETNDKIQLKYLPESRKTQAFSLHFYSRLMKRVHSDFIQYCCLHWVSTGSVLFYKNSSSLLHFFALQVHLQQQAWCLTHDFNSLTHLHFDPTNSCFAFTSMHSKSRVNEQET